MSAERERLERVAAIIGQAIGQTVDEEFGGSGRVGYAMLIFDFGDSGSMAYASNANRDDMIKALAELLEKLRGS